MKGASADFKGNVALGKEIEKWHGRIDTVIANAGKSTAVLLEKKITSYYGVSTYLLSVC